MQIGKLARITQVSVRMLRYYENAGLLNPTRTPSGYRQFSTDDIETVKKIVMLNRSGMNLDLVRHLVGCVSANGTSATPCEALKSKVSQHIDRVDRQIRELSESRALLSGLLPPSGPENSAS